MQPNQPYNSSFEQNFMTSVMHHPAPEAPKEPKKHSKWPIIIIVGLVFAILIGVMIVVLLSKSATKPGPEPEEVPDDPEFVNNVYDQNDVTETLNSAFANAAKSGEHASYSSTEKATLYVDYKPIEVCRAFDIGCSLLATPRKVARKVEVLNGNAVDYYLDQSNIIIMQFYTKEQETDTPNTYVIYAADHEMKTYYAFDPYLSQNYSILNRADLFDDIVGVPDFYVANQLGGN